MREDLKRIKEMLDESQNIIVDIVTISKNFFSITGYPHYENVASSILAFFFDTSEEHGLGDLWVSSLLDCYYSKSTESYKRLSSYNVVDAPIREFRTENNKRIDIVIELDTKSVIAIENKIYATDYNDFGEYSSEIRKKYDGYEEVKVILSLKELKKEDRSGFINITYNELISKVKAQLGFYIDTANEKWLIFMNEFIKNMNDLEGNYTVAIDGEWQKFIKENEKNILDFYKNMENDAKSKEEFLNSVRLKIDEKIIDSNINVRSKTYTSKSYISIVIDITKDNNTITIEPYFYVRPEETKSGIRNIGVLYLPIWVRSPKTIRESIVDKLYNELKKSHNCEKVTLKNDWGNYINFCRYDFEAVNEETFINDIMTCIEEIQKLKID